MERYVISTECFEETVISLSPRTCCTVYELLEKKGGDWIVLTFDDGLISDFEVSFPFLMKQGLKGTFFVNPDHIGKPGYCALAQLREMAQSGMEIGSHGLTHRYLTTMSRSEALREIGESKKRLEQEIGVEVASFAPVGGHYRRWMFEAARKAGYRSFATMIPGKVSVKKGTFLLHRNHIQGHHDAVYIARLLKGKGLAMNRARYYLLRIPKVVLGMQNYDRVKGAALLALSIFSFSKRPLGRGTPGA